MLTCYLDDSGKDPQNSITTLAGYVADDENWRQFELEVDPIFYEKKVSLLHAKDLHSTKGEFKNWRELEKQAFIARICQVMSRHIQLGVSMSAVKQRYKDKAKTSQRKQTASPYSFCFNVIVDWLLTDIRIGRAVNTKGIAFVLENGHENNADVQRCFHAVRQQHKLEQVLHSIRFVAKSSCRAIQMADLIAFYSRRHGVALEKAPIEGRAKIKPSTMMNLLAGSVPIRSLVATDFHNKNEMPF